MYIEATFLIRLLFAISFSIIGYACAQEGYSTKESKFIGIVVGFILGWFLGGLAIERN
tara:strand:- start:393 stop:566 length:174 start_codon:yes stop_codon:yes gene_type:complete